MADKILGEFWDFRPLTQAFKTLWGLAEPRDLATTSWIPNTSQTERMAPPAIIPVPAGAALKNTFPEPFLPLTSWWSVLPSFRGILIKLTERGIEFRNYAKELVMKFNKSITNEVGENSVKNFYHVIDRINKLIKNKKIF